MNLIEKLGLEKCKAIIDGAPESTFPVKWGLGFKTYFRQVGYFVEQWHEGKWQTLYFDPTWVDLETLRTAIANHEKCQHEWNETTSNGDVYRFFVCKHCDSTQNYVPFEADHCTDIRNHISPLTGVIER